MVGNKKVKDGYYVCENKIEKKTYACDQLVITQSRCMQFSIFKFW